MLLLIIITITIKYNYITICYIAIFTHNHVINRRLRNASVFIKYQQTKHFKMTLNEKNWKKLTIYGIL